MSTQHHLRQQPSFQFVILTLLMLASMLSYYVWHEHQEHHAHRQKLAQQAVRSGAREITLQLRNFHANLARGRPTGAGLVGRSCRHKRQ